MVANVLRLFPLQLPISELQARWHLQLLTGKCKSLPTCKGMLRDIERRENTLRKRYYDSKRHTIGVDVGILGTKRFFNLQNLVCFEFLLSLKFIEADLHDRITRSFRSWMRSPASSMRSRICSSCSSATRCSGTTACSSHRCPTSTDCEGHIRTTARPERRSCATSREFGKRSRPGTTTIDRPAASVE